MSSMQTARVLPKDQGETRLETGYIQSQLGDKDSSEKLSLPYFGGGYRRGIAENIDAGVGIVLPGTVRGDVKYQFLNTPELAMASGLGVDYFSLPSGENKYTIIDATVPLYMSYDMADWASAYLNPKLTVRRYAATVQTTVTVNGQEVSNKTNSSSTQALVGASFGLKIGKSGGVIPEATYMANLSSPENSYLGLGLGIFF